MHYTGKHWQIDRHISRNSNLTRLNETKTKKHKQTFQIPSDDYNKHKNFRIQYSNREATKCNTSRICNSKSCQVNFNVKNGWKEIPRIKAISKTANSGHTYSTPTHNQYEISNYYRLLEDTGTDNIESTLLHTSVILNSINTTKLYKINNKPTINIRPKPTKWDTSPITRSRTARRTRWDESPTSKARATANRINNEHRELSTANKLDSEYRNLSSDYTDKINISTSCTKTRWDLPPKDKAKIIANRLIANKNSNLSKITNNSNLPIQSNISKKKPRPHRGRKHRPKNLIKKLNKKDQLKIGFINTQSALHKVLTINDYILEHDLDILYIAESWFNEKGDEVNIGNMIPDGYSFKQTPRVVKSRGGGIAINYKKHIQLKKEIQLIVTTMEIMERFKLFVICEELELILVRCSAINLFAIIIALSFGGRSHLVFVSDVDMFILSV